MTKPVMLHKDKISSLTSKVAVISEEIKDVMTGNATSVSTDVDEEVLEMLKGYTAYDFTGVANSGTDITITSFGVRKYTTDGTMRVYLTFVCNTARDSSSGTYTLLNSTYMKHNTSTVPILRYTNNLQTFVYLSTAGVIFDNGSLGVPAGYTFEIACEIPADIAANITLSVSSSATSQDVSVDLPSTALDLYYDMTDAVNACSSVFAGLTFTKFQLVLRNYDQQYCRLEYAGYSTSSSTTTGTAYWLCDDSVITSTAVSYYSPPASDANALLTSISSVGIFVVLGKDLSSGTSFSGYNVHIGLTSSQFAMGSAVLASSGTTAATKLGISSSLRAAMLPKALPQPKAIASTTATTNEDVGKQTSAYFKYDLLSSEEPLYIVDSSTGVCYFQITVAQWRQYIRNNNTYTTSRLYLTLVPTSSYFISSDEQVKNLTIFGPNTFRTQNETDTFTLYKDTYGTLTINYSDGIVFTTTVNSLCLAGGESLQLATEFDATDTNKLWCGKNNGTNVPSTFEGTPQQTSYDFTSIVNESQSLFTFNNFNIIVRNYDTCFIVIDCNGYLNTSWDTLSYWDGYDLLPTTYISNDIDVFPSPSTSNADNGWWITTASDGRVRIHNDKDITVGTPTAAFALEIHLVAPDGHPFTVNPSGISSNATSSSSGYKETNVLRTVRRVLNAAGLLNHEE